MGFLRLVYFLFARAFVVAVSQVGVDENGVCVFIMRTHSTKVADFMLTNVNCHEILSSHVQLINVVFFLLFVFSTHPPHTK